MENKSYLPDYKSEVKEGISTNLMRRSSPDGRLVQENITTVASDDGSKEYTHEILEEVIPMRVAERIRRKVKEIPVEVTREKIAEDGTVQTDVRKLEPSNLDLDLNKPAVVTLEQVASEVKALRQELHVDEPPQAGLVYVEEPAAVKQKESPTFTERAQSLWGKKRVVDTPPVVPPVTPPVKPPVVPPVVVQQDVSKSELTFTTVAWIVFAVAAGLVTYSLF